MECSACMGTCGGSCKVCSGMCGSGKPKKKKGGALDNEGLQKAIELLKRGLADDIVRDSIRLYYENYTNQQLDAIIQQAKQDILNGAGKAKKVCMSKKDYVDEHKHLIGLLSEAGREGKKQSNELKRMVGGADENSGARQQRQYITPDVARKLKEILAQPNTGGEEEDTRHTALTAYYESSDEGIQNMLDKLFRGGFLSYIEEIGDNDQGKLHIKHMIERIDDNTRDPLSVRGRGVGGADEKKSPFDKAKEKAKAIIAEKEAEVPKEAPKYRTRQETIAIANKDRKGKGHSLAPKGTTVEEVILGHFKKGYTLEHLKTHEDGRMVTFNLFWQPSKQTVDKLNKEFLTFRFHTNGTLSAVRGRQFARDADVLIRRLKQHELM